MITRVNVHPRPATARAIADALRSDNPMTWLTELVDNACQANARWVWIELVGRPLATQVVVRNDGDPPHHPEPVIEYGRTGDQTGQRAGLGFAKLSGIGCELSAAHWRTRLTPAVLRGDEPAVVKTLAPGPHGPGPTMTAILDVPDAVATGSEMLAIARAMRIAPRTAGVYVCEEPPGIGAGARLLRVPSPGAPAGPAPRYWYLAGSMRHRERIAALAPQLQGAFAPGPPPWVRHADWVDDDTAGGGHSHWWAEHDLAQLRRASALVWIGGQPGSEGKHAELGVALERGIPVIAVQPPWAGDDPPERCVFLHLTGQPRPLPEALEAIARLG